MNPARLAARVLSRIARVLEGVSRRLSPPPPAELPNRFMTFFYPGHFYHPIPDPKFVDENAAALFRTDQQSLPGIDDNWSGQLQLLTLLLQYSADYQPAFSLEEAKSRGARFYNDNNFYRQLDAFIYYGMLRHFRPAKIVEVGSGFSSALALDVCEKFSQPFPKMVFIEPYPDRLHELIRAGDRANVEIHEKPVQQVDLNAFAGLGAGDILFIDSSHVSKIGSDVNFLYFEVLPRLPKGVIIHIHDIFWPFEYPKAWVDEGRSWTEAYLVHGILTHSKRYRILYWNSLMAIRRPESLGRLPDWGKPGQAQSIWLEVIS